MEKGERIESLNLSTRTYKALKREGYSTIEDLVSEYEDDIKEIRGLGKVSFQELKKALELRGYKLKSVENVMENGIETLNISTRIYNILRWHGYQTTDDLLTFRSESDIKNMRGLGGGAVEEIKRALQEKGYKLVLTEKSPEELDIVIKKLYDAYADLQKAQKKYDELVSILESNGMQNPIHEQEDGDVGR